MIFHEIKHINASIGQMVLKLPEKSYKVIDQVDSAGYYISGGFLGYNHYGLYTFGRSQLRSIHKAICNRTGRIIPI
jgi:hypothetical protein